MDFIQLTVLAYGKKQKVYVLVVVSVIWRYLLTRVDRLTLCMKAPRSFETSGTTYDYKRRNIPEDSSILEITYPTENYFVLHCVPMAWNELQIKSVCS